MMARLSGKFQGLSEYRSNKELLRYYLNMLKRSLPRGEVLRFHHHAYDRDIAALGYITQEGNVMLILLKGDIPLQPCEDELEKLLSSEYGFIEVYRLSWNEFEVDMEIFHNKFLIWGQDFNNSIIKLETNTFINRIKDKLGITKVLIHRQKHEASTAQEYLTYSERLSRKLEDVTFRASILLRKEYELIETEVSNLISTIYEILVTREESLVIVVRINSHSIWVAKQQGNQVGFLPALNTSDAEHNAELHDKLANLVTKLVSEHKNSNRAKKAKLFIYVL